MKNVLFIALAFLSFNTALAAKTTEYIGSSSCAGIQVDDRYNRLQYLVNAQGQVKMDVEMENRFNSDDINYGEDSYRTPVISSLQASGRLLTHIPTGIVCAKFGKGGALIGPRDWNATSQCQIITKEIREKSYDQDGFANGKTCIRHYYLQVKEK